MLAMCVVGSHRGPRLQSLPLFEVCGWWRWFCSSFRCHCLQRRICKFQSCADTAPLQLHGRYVTCRKCVRAKSKLASFTNPLAAVSRPRGIDAGCRWLDDSMTELSVFWILDQGCPLARKANFWPDPTPFQRFQVNWITESIWISWISHDLFAWIYCWKTEWQQVGIHEHPKVPARETWSVSRHLKVSVCFYWCIFSNILNINISYFLIKAS